MSKIFSVLQWIKITLLLLFLIGSLAASSILVQRKLFTNTKAGSQNASILLPSSINVSSNEFFEIPVMINTDNVEIVGADIAVTFKPGDMELTDIIPKTENSNLKTFLPRGQDNNFNKLQVINNANSTGKIKFSAVSYSGNSAIQGFSGILGLTNPLAILQFKAKNNGVSQVEISFNSSSTADSNLVTRDARSILGRVTNSTIVIGDSSPSPVISPEITMIVINPSISPSLIPSGSRAVQTFSAIEDGYSINNWGNNETSDIIRVGLRYDAGFRFSLPLSSNMRINKAYLLIYLSYVSKAPVTVDIKAEKVLNAVQLTGFDKNTFVLNREYFPESVTWNISGNSIEVSSPDIKNLIQEIVNQPGWQSGNNILVSLIKKNEEYAQFSSKEDSPAKAARLVIEYQ